MSCQVDWDGRPKCHITAHPDRPNEKFCATCNHRFSEPYDWGVLGFLIAVLLTFIIISVNQIQHRSNSTQEMTETIYIQ